MDKNSSPTIGVTLIDFEDKWLLESIDNAISSFFKCRVTHLHLLEDIEFAYHDGRKQYFSTAVLEELDKRAPQDLLKIIALTQKDLFIPILTYVFGEAQLGGRCAILSSYRLMPVSRTPQNLILYQRRMIKEVLHELGHTFTLKHCREKKCIMHYCRRVKDIDQKDTIFCRYCSVFLRDELKRLGCPLQDNKDLFVDNF